MLELIIWGVLFIILILVEANSPQLVAIWFAVGSLGAFIASMFDTFIIVQLGIFVGVSLLLLIFTRPILKKFIVKEVVHTNLDTVIGKRGVVIQKIDGTACTGRAKVDGLDWSARSVDPNVIIEENEVVVVEKLEGVTIWVKRD